MKYLVQFAIILSVSFVGEVLNHFISIPVPASIYGLVIMFALLKTGILKLCHVKETGYFLLGILPIMFVPSSVGFIKAFPLMKKFGVQFVLVAIVSTFLVMGITGIVSQIIIRIQKKHGGEK